MLLDPKEYLGQALPAMLADLNRKGPRATEVLQGAVELHSATAVSSLLDSMSVRPGAMMSTLADSALPQDHPEIDLPGVDLETYLGGGSQGLVYAGKVRATGKIVAVKVLRAEYVASQRWAAREARICGRFRHPNILRVFQAEPAGAYWVVLMELVQGQDLGTLHLPPAVARHCFAQLADALCSLARRGIVHRDIKPGNILIRQQDNSPVVVDFGLAVDLAAPDAEASRVSGTPLYMAPEAFASGIPEPSWDAYSLGVCAAFVLVGEGERCGSLSTLLEAKRSGEFDRTIQHSLEKIDDADLRQWVLALLDRDPVRRLNALETAAHWRAA